MLSTTIGGTPQRYFRELDRAKILEGVTQNMVTPVELVQAVIDGMAARGFGRIVNTTSLSVYVLIPGLDLSCGALADLNSFLASVARTAVDSTSPSTACCARQTRHRPAAWVPHEAGTPEDPAAAPHPRRLAGKAVGRAGGSSARSAPSCAWSTGYLTGQNIPFDGGPYVSAF